MKKHLFRYLAGASLAHLGEFVGDGQGYAYYLHPETGARRHVLLEPNLYVVDTDDPEATIVAFATVAGDKTSSARELQISAETLLQQAGQDGFRAIGAVAA